jgi:MFS transporter, DHA1 family, tetracycline resistance protein
MYKQVSLWLVLLVVFLDEMAVGLVYPMFSSMIFISNGPLLLENASEASKGIYLGILLGALPITSFFFAPILGALSDQKGRKPLYFFSLVLAVLGYSLSIFGVWMKSITTLIIARSLNGIAAGNIGVASATIADLSNAENKAKYFGLFAMASGVGFMIGPVLGGIFSKTSFAMPFFFAGFASLLNLILIFLFFKESHVVKIKSKILFWDGILKIKKAFHLKELKIIFFTVTFFCFAWSFFYEFIPVVWISNLGFDSTKVGFFYAYGSFFYALSSGLLIRPFQKRFKPHALVFYSLLSLGGLILILPFFLYGVFIWIYLPLVNFLVALAYPTYSTIVSDSVDENSQGEILGILQSIQMFAFGISPLLGGFFLGIHPLSPMFLGGFFMLVGAFIFGVFLRKRIFLVK